MLHPSTWSPVLPSLLRLQLYFCSPVISPLQDSFFISAIKLLIRQHPASPPALKSYFPLPVTAELVLDKWDIVIYNNILVFIPISGTLELLKTL